METPRSMDMRGPKTCTLGESKMDLKRVIGRVGTRPPISSKWAYLPIVRCDIVPSKGILDHTYFEWSRTCPKRGPQMDPFEGSKTPHLDPLKQGPEGCIRAVPRD